MDALRWPFFAATVCIFFAAVGIEWGHTAPWSWVIGFFGGSVSTPGLAIEAMAALDGIIIFIMIMIVASAIIPGKIHGRIQGVITLIYCFFAFFALFPLIFVILAKLMVMIGLLLAIPFGTLIYLAKWGDFPTGEAATALALLMFMKLVAGVCLALAHERFLRNFGLVLLIATSLVAIVIINFLHQFPPGILVSITDAIAAIVMVILALIWLIILFIGAIIGTLKAIKSLKEG